MNQDSIEINQLVDLSPHYPALAYHWSETDATEKAIEYLDKSGEQALDNDANREAIQFLRRASDFDQSSDGLSGAPETAPLRLSKRQYELAEAYYRLGQLPESEEHCKNTLESLGHRLPKSSVKLVLKALGLLGHQIGRRFPLPFLSRSSSKSGAEREETILAYQAYLRFTWISFLNSNTTMTVLGTLNCLNRYFPDGLNLFKDATIRDAHTLWSSIEVVNCHPTSSMPRELVDP